MPTSDPPGRAQTTWRHGPVSSSMTGSAPKSAVYQGALASQLRTVTATCPSGGKSAIYPSSDASAGGLPATLTDATLPRLGADVDGRRPGDDRSARGPRRGRL